MSERENREDREKGLGAGRRKRRVLSPEKKFQIFLRSQGGEKPVGEILRREGLYSSDLTHSPTGKGWGTGAVRYPSWGESEGNIGGGI